MNSPRFHSPILYGPVAMGIFIVPSGFHESLCRTAVCPQCSAARLVRKSASALLVFTTTVVASGASTDSIFTPLEPSKSARHSHLVAGSSHFFSDATASAEVMGAPLWNFTLLRSLKV